MSKQTPNDVVGHKTFHDGPGQTRHEPITRAEAEQIWAAVREADKERAARMPDIPSAVKALHEAYIRLKELGFNDACYAKPDRMRELEMIQIGSTGLHRGYCEARPDTDGMTEKDRWFWVFDFGDLYPSSPILFRELAAPRPKAKLDDA